jgi:xanthine dehydrogenase molybdopterin-binding subunit B
MNDVIELPDSTSLGAIGQPLRRKEDERLLTGRGRFSDDFTVPGQTYAAVLRSPHPHARIVEIDTRRALAMPGVLGILTGQDCAADGLSPIPHNPVPQTRYDMNAGGQARSHGLEAGVEMHAFGTVHRHVPEQRALPAAKAVERHRHRDRHIDSNPTHCCRYQNDTGWTAVDPKAALPDVVGRARWNVSAGSHVVANRTAQTRARRDRLR